MTVPPGVLESPKQLKVHSRRGVPCVSPVFPCSAAARRRSHTCGAGSSCRPCSVGRASPCFPPGTPRAWPSCLMNKQRLREQNREGKTGSGPSCRRPRSNWCPSANHKRKGRGDGERLSQCCRSCNLYFCTLGPFSNSFQDVQPRNGERHVEHVNKGESD